MGFPLTLTVPVTLASAVDDSTEGFSPQPHAATERAVAATGADHHRETRMVTYLELIGKGRGTCEPPRGPTRTPSGVPPPPVRWQGQGAGRATRKGEDFGMAGQPRARGSSEWTRLTRRLAR